MEKQEFEEVPSLFQELIAYTPDVSLEDVCNFLKDKKNGIYINSQPHFHSVTWVLSQEMLAAILKNDWNQAILDFLKAEPNLLPPYGKLVVTASRRELYWYYLGDLYSAWSKGKNGPWGVPSVRRLKQVNQ